MKYVFMIAVFGFFMVAIGRSVYWSFDHSGWSSNAKPDASATIVNMSSEKVKYQKNGAKFKTTVSFSDGFYFITHATNREQHLLTYTISIDDSLKRQIIEKATVKHAAAVRKKCGREKTVSGMPTGPATPAPKPLVEPATVPPASGSVDTNEQIVQELFSKGTNSTLAKLFYGDHKKATPVLVSMAKACYGNQPQYTRAQLDRCIFVYTNVWSRLQTDISLGGNTFSNAVSAISRLVPEIPSNVLSEMIEHARGYIYANDARIGLKDILDTYQELAASQNQSISSLHNNDSDYGLLPSKPIFVEGFKGLDTYLAHLCAPDGTHLNSERIEAVTVNKINGPVDKYRMTTPDGSFARTIYISIYGNDTPTKAPRGFQYK